MSRRKAGRRERRWMAAAGVMLAAAVGFAAGAGGESGQWEERETETEEKKLDVEELLALAQTAPEKERLELYRRAVFLCPTSGQAYLQLLAQALSDGDFSREDEAMFAAVAYGTAQGQGCTYLELLKEYPEEYAAVCYRLGEAYWYGGEGKQGREEGARWYWRAWILRASVKKTFPRIKLARWYGMLAQARDKPARWRALVALGKEEPEGQKNFWVENEIGSMVLADSGELLEGGITPEAMAEAVAEAKKRLGEEDLEEGNQGEKEEQWRGQARETLGEAEEAIKRIRQAAERQKAGKVAVQADN